MDAILTELRNLRDQIDTIIEDLERQHEEDSEPDDDNWEYMQSFYHNLTHDGAERYYQFCTEFGLEAEKDSAISKDNQYMQVLVRGSRKLNDRYQIYQRKS